MLSALYFIFKTTKNRTMSIAKDSKELRNCEDYIKPMLLESAARPFDDERFTYEFKFDGVRMIADNRCDCVLYNRNLNLRTHVYLEIVKAVEQLPKGIVLDGEVIAVCENGKQDFYKLLECDLAGRAKKDRTEFFFVAFDILFFNGNDIRGLELRQRKLLLNETLKDCKSQIKNADSHQTIGNLLFQTAQKERLEGIVAKRLDSVYKSGSRSGDWLKIKCMKYMDVFVVGYALKSRPSLYLGVPEGGTLKYVGNVSNGLSDAKWAELTKQLEKLKTGEVFVKPVDSEMISVVPKIVLNVKYLEQGNSGKLRQPTINKIY